MPGSPGTLQLSAALALTGSAAALLWYMNQRRNMPPGPTSLPFVGNLIEILKNKDCAPTLFNRWADKYGPLYLIRIGSINAVVINTLDLIKETMGIRAMVFCDRPSCLPILKLVYQGKGLVWQNGDQWKDLREFTAKALRCCGVGNESLEDRTLFEMDKLIYEFTLFESPGYPFDPSDVIHQAVTNILCSAMFGCRYKYNSKRMNHLVCMVRQNLSNCNLFHSANMFQCQSADCQAELEKIDCKALCSEPPSCGIVTDNLCSEGLQSAAGNAKCLLEFIGEEIERHKEDFDANNIRDFIDEYLKMLCNDRSKKKNICRQNVEASIMDTFTYGTEPVSSLLRWALLCMVEYPDIQKKCQEEIDSVIGCGRIASFDDDCCLPYVKATLMEVMRRFTILPLGLPHLTKEKTCLLDYPIPAKSLLICNHHAIHMNSHYWSDPCKFCPDRFVEDSCGIGRIKLNEAFIPYGMGPRGCPGAELTNKMSFVIFTSLLQRFDFEKGCECQCCHDDGDPGLAGVFDVVYAPVPFKVKIRMHSN